MLEAGREREREESNLTDISVEGKSECRIEETTRNIGEVHVGVEGYKFGIAIRLFDHMATHAEVFVSDVVQSQA